jgi:aquaporin Z
MLFPCLAAGKCCGASMNPARSLAPALFAGGAARNILRLYIGAPSIGAVLAAWIYDPVHSKEERVPSVPTFEEPAGTRPEALV